MKQLLKCLLFVLPLITLLVSCSHHQGAERSLATESCLNSVRGEYHSYFDSVEKCLEKESKK